MRLVKNLLSRLRRIRITKRQAIILIALLTIFGVALYVRLSVTLTYELPLGMDGPYNFYQVRYLTEHWPSMLSSDPPLFYHFSAVTHAVLSVFGTSLMTSFNVATALVSALVVLTTYFLVKQLTKNTLTALLAAFFSGFVNASYRMLELHKNALGVSIAPLSVLFFWRGVEERKRLYLIISGVFLGLTLLAHEVVAGTLVIAYLSYLGLLIGYRRRLPFGEIKAMLWVAIPAALVGGWFLYIRMGAIVHIGGEESFFRAAPAERFLPIYSSTIGAPLIVLATFGAGVAAYRRRAQDLFLLAWGMSALIMAQPWVPADYLWRFILQFATPVIMLAAVGVAEGILPAFRKLDKFSIGAGKLSKSSLLSKIAKPSGIAFISMLFGVMIYQANVSVAYAWDNSAIRPRITMDEYEALQGLYQQVGNSYVFGSMNYYYWADVVGLKGAIQGGEVWKSLSGYLHAGKIPASQRAAMLASNWYERQEEVGENIYAVVSFRDREAIQLLNGQPFVLIFNHPDLRAYALSEDFIPPEAPQSHGSVVGFRLSPQQEKEGYLALLASNPIRVLILPIDLFDYVLSGFPAAAAKFAVGVPLTVMLWVIVPCLLWGLIRKHINRHEECRKVLVICAVFVLTLAAILVI